MEDLESKAEALREALLQAGADWAKLYEENKWLRAEADEAHRTVSGERTEHNETKALVVALEAEVERMRYSLLAQTQRGDECRDVNIRVGHERDEARAEVERLEEAIDGKWGWREVVEMLRSKNACLRTALEQEKAFRLYGWTKFDPSVTDRALALDAEATARAALRGER
jgi:hypothetical protein